VINGCSDLVLAVYGEEAGARSTSHVRNSNSLRKSWFWELWASQTARMGNQNETGERGGLFPFGFGNDEVAFGMPWTFVLVKHRKIEGICGLNCLGDKSSGRFRLMGESLLDRITLNSDQCGGRACIRGMRIRVTDVLGMLAEGVSEKEILDDYPYLEPEDIRACLLYAARATDHVVLTAA
jgi:uncharacterized protein (DUF433 family)